MEGKELLGAKKQTILIIGPSGSGKTNLFVEGATREFMRKAYIFDTDFRLNSVLSRYGKESLSHLRYDRFRESAVLPGASFAAVTKKKRELLTLDKNKDPECPRTVIVDSGTFLAKLAMAEILRLDGKSSESTPGLNHYGTLTAKIETFVSEMTSASWNFIMTVHNDLIKDEVTGQVSHGIALTRKLRGMLPGYFNEIWETAVKMKFDPKTKVMTPEYEVHPRPAGGFLTRTCNSDYKQVESHASMWDKMESWLNALEAERLLTQ